jgi:hypothetical protein
VAHTSGSALQVLQMTSGDPKNSRFREDLLQQVGEVKGYKQGATADKQQAARSKLLCDIREHGEFMDHLCAFYFMRSAWAQWIARC